MLKIVAISDTHNEKPTLPSGDLLIVAGDWSGHGSYQETRDFLNYLESIKFNYKRICCVPGNHDLFVHDNIGQANQEFKDIGVELLIDEGTYFEGLQIWGSPWTPVHRCMWMGFMAESEARKRRADGIPDDINVLITHSPPFGVLDQLGERSGQFGKNAGCEHIRDAILRISPVLNVCGHIHENSGTALLDKTMVVNAAHRDEWFRSANGFKTIYI